MFLGRLNSIKGPDLLLRAFSAVKEELKDAHLVFVGPNGGMLTTLKKMAVEFRVSNRIHFIGYLGGTEKSQAYHSADILVIPSRQEAMSIVVLEAGITGTPVLLTDQCGFNSLASIGGGLVVPASVNGLKEGLIEILRDSAQLKVYGSTLKKYVYEHLTWDSIANKYLKLYRQILDEKG
jgi:glycosyltransferase involved in cell wall biosynthesis